MNFMKREMGFTLIELIVGMTIVLTIFGLTFINFTPLPSRTSSSASSFTILSDIKAQQTRAMSGDAEGAVQSDYGIHFENTSYTLFTGPSYVPGASGNFSVEFTDANLSFTGVTFPNSSIVFAKGSGETIPGSFEITNSLTGEVKTFNLNKYGATY